MNLETFLDIKSGTELYSIYKIDCADGTFYRLYDFWHNKFIYESNDLQAVKIIGYNLTTEYTKITDDEIQAFIDEQERIANDR